MTNGYKARLEYNVARSSTPLPQFTFTFIYLVASQHLLSPLSLRYLQCASLYHLSPLLAFFRLYLRLLWVVSHFLVSRLTHKFNIYSFNFLEGCALPCVANANFGSCSHQDNACLCKSQAFINSTTTCIQGACQGQDLQNAEAYSQAICKSVVRPFSFHNHFYCVLMRVG